MRRRPTSLVSKRSWTRSSRGRRNVERMDAFSSAIDIAKAIRSKQVSPVEVADLFLERIDRFEPTLNAFAHRADDEVRAAAARAADAVAQPTAHDLPPFHG